LTFLHACAHIRGEEDQIIIPQQNHDEERISASEESDVEADHGYSQSETDSDFEDIVDDEGDIDVFSEGSDSSDSSESDEEEVEDLEDVGDLDNPKGIVYSKTPYPPHLLRRNVLTQRPRTLIHPVSAKDSFHSLLTEQMCYHVLRCTNIKVRSLHRAPYPRNHGPFTYCEFQACLAILIRAGVDRDNFTDLHDLWDTKESRPFYRATISLQRFKFFLQTVRFDDIRTREQRRQTDTLAAFRELWSMFILQSRSVYVPAGDLTVDEQLVGYRGRIPGRTYMPSKPRKYGVKIFWICESESGYALLGIIYTGRQPNEPPHQNLAKHLVEELAAPFFNTGRNIVCDNYFTSHELATELVSKNLTLLGTIRAHRREIPRYLRTIDNRPCFDSRFVFDHNTKTLITSYIPKKKKNVLLLSSGAHNNAVDLTTVTKKPLMIYDYNQTKGGVDRLDECVEMFSVRRKTTRWPLLLFFNLLDVACYNSYVIMRKFHPHLQRKQYLKDLAFQLGETYANTVRLKWKTLHAHIFTAAKLVGYTVPTPAQPNSLQTRPGNCDVCRRKCRSVCQMCKNYACPAHRMLVKTTSCINCQIPQL
jgi:hypothetical protein